MNITQEKELLVISTSKQGKEIILSLIAIALASFVAYIWISPLSGVIFVISVVWCAILNISDEEHCTFDNKKETITLIKEGFLMNRGDKKRVVVMGMNELVDVQVEDNQPAKRKAHRVRLLFDDGVILPLTDAYFTAAVNVRSVAERIKDYAGLKERENDGHNDE